MISLNEKTRNGYYWDSKPREIFHFFRQKYMPQPHLLFSRSNFDVSSLWISLVIPDYLNDVDVSFLESERRSVCSMTCFFFQEASDRWSLGFFFTSLSQWEHEKRKPISFLLIIGMTSKIVKLEFLGSRLMDPCAYFKTWVRLGDDNVIMVYAEVIWRSSKDFGVAQPSYSLYNAPL